MPSSSIEFLPVGEIVDLYELGSLSEFEFVTLLERRWKFLDKKIRTCTTGNSSWNDFQLWKSERHEIYEIYETLEKIPV